MNSEVMGFTNHLWNGVTTLQFSKIVCGIIDDESFRSGQFHIVPEDFVSKFELLKLIALSFNRSDLTILPSGSQPAVDRRLTTVKENDNLGLWRSAKYHSPPTISFMVNEFVDFLNNNRSEINDF
jgi:dTDP-4-dehydrorhamnose reductase